MDLPDLTDWVTKFANKIDVEFIVCGNKLTDEQLYSILRKSGIPLNFAKRWCLRIWKMLPTNKFIKENGLDQRNDIVFVEGLRKEEGGVREFAEERSIRKNDNVRIARPILNLKTKDVFDIIKKKGWERHWIYDSGFPRLGCLFCFATKRKEWDIMRKNMPDMWMRALRFLAEGACSDNIAGSDVVYYLRKMLGLDTVEGSRKKDSLPKRRPWCGDRDRTDD
jgi:3'-phosphoadenosine 5'-phosphosulfate sulfotransferase (PAPS reductase)/FAD synthetase